MAENITPLIHQLLKEIGPGRMSTTAYDTAWIARLGDIDWELSSQALNWICESQLPDGSWGASEPFYYHDRFISTLAAMIALTYRGRRTQDHKQIERGIQALERIAAGAIQGLQADHNGATVGFELIAPTLVAEAEKLGIIKKQSNNILSQLSHLRKAKMAKFAGQKINRQITPAFSAEMTGRDMLNMLDIDNLQEANGSVGNSPAATAHFALYPRPGDPQALAYLHDAVREGGAPFAIPFDVFERSWVLWNISLLAPLDNEMLACCQPHLDFLEKAWRPGSGVSFSISYTPCDGDNTSMTYEVSGSLGRTLDVETVLKYEEEDHFRCYPLEINSSVSVNVHAIGALRQAGFGSEHPSVKKVISYLRKTRRQGKFWLDKWHTSPYYPTAHAVILCQGYDDELCRDAINWILDTQKADGSWGYFNFSTAEETAYCLQALKLWERMGKKLPPDKIERGIHWLTQHADLPYPHLWIGKVLYCPDYVIRSAILSALALTR